MPLYAYKCQVGCQSERFLTLAMHSQPQMCERHGYVLEQIITAPLLVKVAADVHYTSPIDERPITSWHAREEDLKRNNCIPYDPGSKQDYTRRIAESEAALDQSVEASVEEAIEKMPTAQRGRLQSELVDQGMNADVIRV